MLIPNPELILGSWRSDRKPNSLPPSSFANKSFTLMIAFHQQVVEQRGYRNFWGVGIPHVVEQSSIASLMRVCAVMVLLKICPAIDSHILMTQDPEICSISQSPPPGQRENNFVWRSKSFIL